MKVISPRDKAGEILDKFHQIVLCVRTEDTYDVSISFEDAQTCALHCVNVLLKELEELGDEKKVSYFREVRNEIEQL